MRQYRIDLADSERQHGFKTAFRCTQIAAADLNPGTVARYARSIPKSRVPTESYVCCSMSFFLRDEAFTAFAVFAVDDTFLAATLTTPIF